MPIVMDGVISCVAALLATRMEPGCRDYLLASHQSREPAAHLILAELKRAPLLHADMALGEGTGAVALLPLIDMALAVYHQERTFEQLNMTPYVPSELQTL
jgi:nicotinate-nucleotide--dimethylbenzimidazole phosphoribosyltransferase